MNIITKTIDKIGQHGPFILLFISFYLFWNKPTIGFYYLVGFFINSILNTILKGIIQEPRPNDDKNKFNIALKNAKRPLFKDTGMPFDIFGMPSGHTQSCFYSTIFVFLTLGKINILILYLLISFITIYQRVEYKFHTIMQTVVGAIVGSFFAYYLYYLVKQKTKGKIRGKPDDYGPI
jgi:membrane-associated phospholipid phosphatase